MRIQMIPCVQSGYPLLALGVPDPCVGTGVLEYSENPTPLRVLRVRHVGLRLSGVGVPCA
jgi:hypothetical protein